MKTLKQFYDGLSKTSQDWFKDECKVWFDESQPDYLRRYKPVTESMADVEFKSSYTPKGGYSYYGSDDKEKDLESMWVSDLVHKRDELKVITDKQLADTLIDYYDKMKEFHSRKTLLACNERANQVAVMKHYVSKNYETAPLCYGLFFVEDYDKIMEQLNFESVNVRSYSTRQFVTIVEIFGDGALEKIATENPGDFACKYHDLYEEANGTYSPKQEYVDTYERMQRIFDRKFFVDNSWTDSQKRDIVKAMYSSDWSDRAVRRFEEFAREILSVDHRYSRFIYDLVRECPSLGNKIYEAKKPDDEINPNDGVDMTFRYSKEIRKLGKLANICVRESLSKANNSFLKEIGSLIRLTGYHFNEIYDMMYPDEAGELTC